MRRPAERMTWMNVERKMNPLQGASVALCGCDTDDLTPLAALLAQMGCNVYLPETAEQLNSLLHGEEIDTVLMQVCPSRRQFLPIVGRTGIPPVVPLLRHADKHLYMELLHRGAFDCVSLPVQRSELKRVLSLAIEEKRKQLTVSHAA